MGASLLVATLNSYKKCILEASKALWRGWIIIPTSVALYIGVTILTGLLAPMGMAGGFVLGLVFCIALSYYYSWIGALVRGEKLEWGELFEFDYPLFSSVINVGFIFWIVFFLIGHMIQGVGVDWILTTLQLGSVLIFNPTAEIIYMERVGGGMHALRESSEFASANWIEWFLPIVLLLAPYLVLAPHMALSILSASDILLPMLTIVTAAVSLLPVPFFAAAVLISVLGTWCMVFRGYLYRELSSGSRRQRAYRWSQK